MLKRLVNTQSSAILTLLFGAIFWIATLTIFSDVSYFHQTPSMPVFAFLEKYINVNDYVSKLVALILIVVQAFILFRINTAFNIFPSRGYLMSFLFLLISAPFVFDLNFNPVVISNFFLLLVINKILKTYKEKRSINSYFDIGLVLALGSLFHFYFLFFIVFVWAAQLVIRPLKWREWAVTILGILTVYLLIAGYYLFFGNDLYAVYALLKSKFSPPLVSVAFPNRAIPFIFTLGIFVFIGFRKIVNMMQRQKVSSRKYSAALFWVIPTSILIYFVFPQVGTEMIFYLAIPLSFYATIYLSNIKKRWVGEVFLWILLILAFYSQYYEGVITVLGGIF